jgi:uncharacterized protein YdaU (DUF1376 family)
MERVGKDPAMPLYVNDWLSSRRVQTMTQLQELAYFRLLCFCWTSGDASLPDDDNQLAVLSRMGEEWFKGSSTTVKECFNKHPTKVAHLTNERLYDLWRERQEWRDKCRAAGRKSGRIRGKRKAKGSSTVVELNGNSSSSSSSPSSYVLSLEKKEPKKAFARPTVEEVRTYCTERGNAVDPETFVSHYEANGWKVGPNSMKDWQAAVRTWEKNGLRYAANGTEPKRKLSERGK